MGLSVEPLKRGEALRSHDRRLGPVLCVPVVTKGGHEACPELTYALDAYVVGTQRDTSRRGPYLLP